MEELILKERETKEKLVQIINDSKIPAFILKSILKDLLEQICILEQRQYNNALKSKIELKPKMKKGEKNGEN